MSRLQLYGLSKGLMTECGNITNKKIIKNIRNELKMAASQRGVVSLSGIQLDHSEMMFVWLKTQYLKNDKWGGYNKVKERDYQTVINPEIEDHSVKKIKLWESCPSYPGLKMLVNRSCSIKANWEDEDPLKQKEAELTEFEARIFQHEYSHLKGEDLIAIS